MPTLTFSPKIDYFSKKVVDMARLGLGRLQRRCADVFGTESSIFDQVGSVFALTAGFAKYEPQLFKNRGFGAKIVRKTLGK